jgi:hypothetical protein
LAYTVITYSASGKQMSVYTTPPGFEPDPRQLVKNALDLEGSKTAKVWEGHPEEIADRKPLHTLHWER